MNSAGRRPPVFYGWFALAGAMLVIFIVGGAFVNSFAVLLPVITERFDWSRGVVAAGLSMGILAFGVPSPLYGIIVARLGPRTTIILGNLLAGLGIGGVYFVHEIWHIYVLYIIIGLGGGFGGYIAATTIINNWFIKKRSLALGMFTACAGLGGIVFPPLTTALIDAIDWRYTWLVLSGMILVIAVFIGGVVLVRNRPEDMGQLADGEPAGLPDTKNLEPTEGPARRESWRLTDVLKKPTAWLLGGLVAANSFSMGTMVTHQIAYLQDIDFSPLTAAATLSFMSVFSLIGSLGYGALAMRFNVRFLTCAAFCVQLVGLVILLSSRQLGMIYVYAAFQGLSNGSLITALPTLVGTYYPRERYARVLGVIFPFQVVPNAVAATVAGAIFDASSSYTPAFIIAAAFSLAGLFFAFFARRPQEMFEAEAQTA